MAAVHSEVPSLVVREGVKHLSCSIQGRYMYVMHAVTISLLLQAYVTLEHRICRHLDFDSVE